MNTLSVVLLLALLMVIAILLVVIFCQLSNLGEQLHDQNELARESLMLQKRQLTLAERSCS